jgi:hypothetical protein
MQSERTAFEADNRGAGQGFGHAKILRFFAQQGCCAALFLLFHGVLMSSSIFAAVEMAPRDPILGLNESFNADTRSTKVNLGVGVYFDDNGKIPAAGAVKAAEMPASRLPAARLSADRRRPAYNQAVQNLLFGKDSRCSPMARSSPPRPGRHRRPEDRCRLPEAPEPERQGLHQRPILGKPPRPVRVGRFRGRELPVLRCRHPWR